MLPMKATEHPTHRIQRKMTMKTHISGETIPEAIALIAAANVVQSPRDSYVPQHT